MTDTLEGPWNAPGRMSEDDIGVCRTHWSNSFRCTLTFHWWHGRLGWSRLLVSCDYKDYNTGEIRTLNIATVSKLRITSWVAWTSYFFVVCISVPVVHRIWQPLRAWVLQTFLLCLQTKITCNTKLKFHHFTWIADSKP